MKAVAIKQYLRQHRDLRNRVFSKTRFLAGELALNVPERLRN
jgi:hypothetical protein